MGRPSRRAYALAGIALAAILFVALNLISNLWLNTFRFDLTENGLYSVSPGTKATLAKLQEPVTLRLYYSRDAAAGYAQIVAYAGRVHDLLQEYKALAGSKLLVEEIDPAPFTPAEDEAMAQGLTAAPTQEGDNVYFGLVGTNTLDGRQTIPFFDQGREQYLEYDLTALISKLATPQKPKLGILSTLPLEAGAGGLQAALAGNGQPFTLYQQLRDAFDVQMLDTSVDRIPADISTLLIVHPAGFSDRTLYAVDQFVLKGGHAVAFVDPLSEVMAQGGNPGLPDSGDRSSSTLGPLFRAWGVAYDPTKVVTDADLAQQVQVGGPNGQPQIVDYIAWLRLAKENFNASDPITANLQQVNMGSVGALKPLAGAATRFTPLLTSSTSAALMNASEVRATLNPNDLLRHFESTGEKFTIGARIQGAAKTAFPNGPPSATPPAPTAEDALPPAALPAQIKDSPDINVVVIADSDIFDDRFWVQTQNVLGQRVAVPAADNGALVLNAVQNMMGSNDLISLRTRERSARPFTLVEAIRKDAEGRFLAEEQQLQDRVTQTETSLRALEGQNAGNQAAPKGEMLSKEQQAQIEKFRRDLVQTRTSLRSVQANLRRDVENLGSLLALINIALVPLLVAAVAVGLAFLRRRRRARARILT